MSALPKSLPEPLNDVTAEYSLSAIKSRARAGFVVVCGESAEFDGSVCENWASSKVIWSELSSGAIAVDSRLSKLARDPVVVLDLSSLESDQILVAMNLIPAVCPVVLLCSEDAPHGEQLAYDNIVFRLINNATLGQQWAEFQSMRAYNRLRLVVIDMTTTERASEISRYLVLRSFQTVVASEREATTFVHASDGSQVLYLELSADSDKTAHYVQKLRLSHESDALGVIVEVPPLAHAARCDLLAAGVDELFEPAWSLRELELKILALSREQTRAQQIRLDAYRFPGSLAYNTDYLISAGTKLYASAQREVITMALGVMKVVFVEGENTAEISVQERNKLTQSVASYCCKNLRETDLFAQAGECEFIALVTCVGRNNISRVFGRLTAEINKLVERSSDGRLGVRMDIGVTCELGSSFKKMLERAQVALSIAEQNADNSIVVN